MKDTLLKALKIFIIFMLIALAVLLIYELTHQSSLLTISILLGLIGVVIALILLRKIWLKRKEKLFIQKIIDQDEAHLKSLAQKDKDQLKQLQDRWKESIETLKNSNLRKYGNPLYVLPWYLVIGESGSGKTTAIQSARLSSPFTEVNQISGISGTRNCDWWFFEKAIIIDTAGRYTIPIDQSKDKEEWKSFIGLLAKYRKREPLNGLIVTIAANKLIEASPEALKEDGRVVRRRINELIRVLGAKPPIYILVTKCDLIQGMTKFCDQLPDKALDQAMGFINQDLSKDVVGFLKRSIDTLVDRLRDFRLILLHKSEASSPDPGLLLFPEELKNIENGLKSFLQEGFQENPYQETQILRGIFFSSGRQEGSPFSHFLNALGLIEEKDVLAGTNKGLFLHDFFAKIIPRDRHIYAPTRINTEWKRLTKSLGLTSWVAIWLALCVFLGFAIKKDRDTLNKARELSPYPELHGEIFSDANIMYIMYRFSNKILEVEDHSFTIFGLNESKKIKFNAKKSYVQLFQKRILTPLNRQLKEQREEMFKAKPELIGLYVSHLATRINFLRRNEQTEEVNFEPFIPESDKQQISKINDKLSNLYRNYLDWNQEDPNVIKHELALILPMLQDILTSNVPWLWWLEPWANDQETLSYVTLDYFWKDSIPIRGGARVDGSSVAPAFTTDGKKKIDTFLKEIESAIPDSNFSIITEITERKKEFNDRYKKAYMDAWYRFGTIFNEGKQKLKGRLEWQDMAKKMPNDQGYEQGPLFKLLDKMSIELEPFKDEEYVPSWMKLLYDFPLIKEKGLFEKHPPQNMKGDEVKRREELEERAAKAYQEYSEALEYVFEICERKKDSYDTALKVYKNPINNDTHFYSAKEAIRDLKDTLEELNKNIPGTSSKEQEMFWELVNGPLNYLWTIVCKETACYLQDEWNEKVIKGIQEIPDAEAAFKVLSKNGEANEFKVKIDPFLEWKQNSFEPKSVLGEKIPFKTKFLSFLKKSDYVSNIADKSFEVEIKGGLIGVDNPKAAKKLPKSTLLELECIEGKSEQKLKSHHYSPTETFFWSPADICENVSLKITMTDDTELTKNYKGYNAFPRFLDDFKSGEHKFYPNKDGFSDNRAYLKENNIKYIKVRYELKGDEEVRYKLKGVPKKVPKDIIECWE